MTVKISENGFAKPVRWSLVFSEPFGGTITMVDPRFRAQSVDKTVDSHVWR
jgi:hypothetical protein